MCMCDKCGNKVEKGDIFCPMCGNKLGNLLEKEGDDNCSDALVDKDISSSNCSNCPETESDSQSEPKSTTARDILGVVVILLFVFRLIFRFVMSQHNQANPLETAKVRIAEAQFDQGVRYVF